MSSHKFVFKTQPQKVRKIQTSYRDISTAIPAPGTEEIVNGLSEFEASSMHGQMPIAWKKADDFNIFDIAENKFIDFTSTIFVANVGHSNTRIKKAIQKSLDGSLLNCYAYANEVKLRYLKKLLKFSGPGFEKAFLLSSGTEATESALKLMRMHGKRVGKQKQVIICIDGNWHGRTMGAQLMSSNLGQREWIGEVDFEIEFIKFPYPWDVNEESGRGFFNKEINKLIKNGFDPRRDIAGVMLETFQGWGAIFYPKSFVNEITKFCIEHEILLCFDEMQAGFGRTGKNFGFEHYEVKPDLFCVGKGMGGGVPISGVIGKKHILDLPEIGNMSSTHSANPLCCYAAEAVIDELLEKKLVIMAAQKGEVFLSALTILKDKFSERISYISGQGMIWAIIFKNPQNGKPDANFASALAEKCMQKGLLVVHTGRESIKIGPPLSIPTEAILEGISIIDEGIEELTLLSS